MATSTIPIELTIDAPAVRDYVRRCGAAVRRHAEMLTRLDATLGDGDHGDNLLIGFSAVDEMLDADEPGTIGAILSSVGTALVTSVGGASAALRRGVHRGRLRRSRHGTPRCPGACGPGAGRG